MVASILAPSAFYRTIREEGRGFSRPADHSHLDKGPIALWAHQYRDDTWTIFLAGCCPIPQDVFGAKGKYGPNHAARSQLPY